MFIYAKFIIVFAGLTFGKNLKHDVSINKKLFHVTSNAKKSVSFLLFSDVHLDLMYKKTADKSEFCRNESIKSSSASYGRIGCDAPLSLFQNAMSTMKQKASHLSKLDFILAPGDMTAHDVKEDRRIEILKLMKRTSQEIKSVFPSTPYFPSIGNNDLPGHYGMPVENDTWYDDLLNIWQDAILCKDCGMTYQTTTVNELRRTFLYGGYYSVSIADGTMTLLILNSMYWTRSTWRPKDYFIKRAEAQMKWLEKQLKLAKKRKKKVLISSHIPPGMDIYAFTSMWMKQFTENYIDLVVNKFSDVIAGQIFSHFHRDSFRFLSDKKKDPSLQNSSYILLMPSISPAYRNNPAFRIVHVDPDLQAITDYEQYYTNISRRETGNPVWQLDYKFSSRYPPSGSDDQVINGKRIKKLSDNLINQSDDSFFNRFVSSRQVRYQPDPCSRFVYFCAITCIKQKEFNACRKKYFKKKPPDKCDPTFNAKLLFNQ